MTDEQDDVRFTPLERRFVEQLRAAREDRGWSQTDLVERVRGVLPYMNQSTLSRIELMARPIRLIEAQVFATAIDRTLYSLMFPESTVPFETLTRAFERVLHATTAVHAAATQLGEERSRLEHDLRLAQEAQELGPDLDPASSERFTQLLTDARKLLDVDLSTYVAGALGPHEHPRAS